MLTRRDWLRSVGVAGLALPGWLPLLAAARCSGLCSGTCLGSRADPRNRRRDFLPGSQEVKWRDGNPATNAAVAAP